MNGNLLADRVQRGEDFQAALRDVSDLGDPEMAAHAHFRKALDGQPNGPLQAAGGAAAKSGQHRGNVDPLVEIHSDLAGAEPDKPSLDAVMRREMNADRLLA